MRSREEGHFAAVTELVNFIQVYSPNNSSKVNLEVSRSYSVISVISSVGLQSLSVWNLACSQANFIFGGSFWLGLPLVTIFVTKIGSERHPFVWS